MEHTDIGNRFSFHKVDNDTSSIMQNIRDACCTLADEINGAVPNGREKSLAITKLEEVMFWSVAGLARSGEEKQDA